LCTACKQATIIGATWVTNAEVSTLISMEDGVEGMIFTVQLSKFVKIHKNAKLKKSSYKILANVTPGLLSSKLFYLPPSSVPLPPVHVSLTSAPVFGLVSLHPFPVSLHPAVSLTLLPVPLLSLFYCLLSLFPVPLSLPHLLPWPLFSISLPLVTLPWPTFPLPSLRTLFPHLLSLFSCFLFPRSSFGFVLKFKVSI
jgi:hypothetical protein